MDVLYSFVLQPTKGPGLDYLSGCVREKVSALAVFLISYQLANKRSQLRAL